MNSIDEMVSKPAGRREFLLRLGSAGLGVAAGTFIAGCGGGSNSNNNPTSAQSSSLDTQILNAAATAEALATTMYYNIINSPIYTSSLSGNTPDQAYLVAAYEQEISHYNTLVSAGAAPLTTTFYFPTAMFTNTSGSTGGLQTTINTLSVLEDAFIAAYLYAISAFSQTADKVLAGQILGIESEHRTLARVIAHDVGLSGTAAFNGNTENVTPPSAAANNLAYERTYGVTSLQTILNALQPFTQSGASGFSTTPYTYANSTSNGGSKLSTSVTLDPSAPGQ